jgi:hypothetical protein
VTFVRPQNTVRLRKNHEFYVQCDRLLLSPVRRLRRPAGATRKAFVRCDCYSRRSVEHIRLNLGEDLAAGPARLEVVVAFLGLLQGERAVDLCVGNTPETKAPWEPVPKSFLRGDGTANVVASNDCLIYGERACVTTIATDVCLIGNVRRRRPREKMRKEKG